jgi:hypothetical protein
MTRQLPDDWPLPAQYLTELGRITTLFASLESAVNLYISKLAGYQGVLDWRSAVVTAHANFKQRIDILETLCHELHDEGSYTHLKSYKKVLENIKQVQLKRNRYTHNALSFDGESGHVTSSSLSARGKLLPRVDRVSLEEMKELSAQVHLAMLSLHELVTQKRYPPVWEK